MISVKNLVKTYNSDKPAVNDVSFDISRGEIVGLLGPNGAGKTTIMRVLTCFLSPTAGEICIDGTNILDNPLLVKSKIGYLPEHAPQYEDMIVYEYLKFIAEVRGIAKEQIPEAIARMIELVALEKVVSKKIGQLSNGFKKRVGLASAMIHDPEILILDEPTAGLDPNQIIMFRKILRKFSEKKTVILSTHILSEIEAICERVLIIKNGIIVANDNLQDLSAKYKDENFVDFAIEVKDDPLLTVEPVVNGIKGAWKIEFVKKDGKNVFKFKALISKDSDFETNLSSVVKDKGWKLVYAERNSANLEDLFLKMTNEGEENV